MIDNFELIESLLSFDSEDEFYFVQVLVRKKDNPDGVFGSNNSSRLVKAYYIKSRDQLRKQKDEMIALANLFNARVGINLNRRSFYKSAFNLLKKLAESMHNKEFDKLHRAYNTVCGLHNSVSDKIWLIDVDWKDGYNPGDVNVIVNHVNAIRNPPGDKVICTIPTRDGIHIITRSFDLRGFDDNFAGLDIHKNNPTILYIP